MPLGTRSIVNAPAEIVEVLASFPSAAFLFGLPADYYQYFPEKIREVTATDVRRVAREHLRPEAMQIVVVGDKASLIDELPHLKRGSVHVHDADGQPIQ